MFNRNPWVKGFRPPSKCRNCSRVNTMVYTGTYDEWGNHVYKCEACRALVAAATSYAECNLTIEALQKDVFFTPCIKCPERRMSPTEGICIHFKPKAPSKLGLVKEIEKRMKRYRPVRGD